MSQSYIHFFFFARHGLACLWIFSHQISELTWCSYLQRVGSRLRLQDKSPAALPTAFPGNSNHWAGHSAGRGVRLTFPKPFCCTHTHHLPVVRLPHWWVENPNDSLSSATQFIPQHWAEFLGLCPFFRGKAHPF